MGTGFAKRKKEAKKFQEAFAKAGENLRKSEAQGQAGNGLVQVTLTGDYQIKSLKIDPQCVDPEDVEGLQDLIRAAFKDAVQKLEGAHQELSGGLNLGL